MPIQPYYWFPALVMDALPPNLDQVPALPPPPGEASNLDSGRAPSQTAIMAVAGIFLPLMLIAVITRAYVRTRIIKLWGIDDSEFNPVYLSGGLADFLQQLAFLRPWVQPQPLVESY
jgi:hypothetical protein